MFHFYFERKNVKVLTFNIVHFSKLEISAAIYKHCTSQFHNLISAQETLFYFKDKRILIITFITEKCVI